MDVEFSVECGVMLIENITPHFILINVVPQLAENKSPLLTDVDGMCLL